LRTGKRLSAGNCDNDIFQDHQSVIILKAYYDKGSEVIILGDMKVRFIIHSIIKGSKDEIISEYIRLIGAYYDVIEEASKY
jgi:hypothetical protein